MPQIKICELPGCSKPVPYDSRNAARGKYCSKEHARATHAIQKRDSKRRKRHPKPKPEPPEWAKPGHFRYGCPWGQFSSAHEAFVCGMKQLRERLRDRYPEQPKFFSMDLSELMAEQAEWKRRCLQTLEAEWDRMLESGEVGPADEIPKSWTATPYGVFPTALDADHAAAILDYEDAAAGNEATTCPAEVLASLKQKSHKYSWRSWWAAENIEDDSGLEIVEWFDAYMEKRGLAA